jgi:hypothetical protein
MSSPVNNPIKAAKKHPNTDTELMLQGKLQKSTTAKQQLQIITRKLLKQIQPPRISGAVSELTTNKAPAGAGPRPR